MPEQIKEFISDDEMSQLEKEGKAEIPNFISDEEMLKMEEEATRPKTLLEKTASAAGSVLDPASKFLFGTFSKVAGTGLLKGAEKIEALQKIVGAKRAEEIIQNLPVTTPTDIVTAAIEAPYGLGIITKGVSKIPGAKQLGGKIMESAVKSYKDLLAPTKEYFKKITEKIAPKLLEKGIVVPSKKALQEMAEFKASQYGQAIGDAFEVLPEGSKIEITPILNKLQKMKDDFMVGGTIVEPKAVKAIENIQNMFLDLAQKSGGTEIDIKNLRKIRQIFDNSIAKKGAFVATDLKQFADEARKVASNGIREELAKNYPDIAKLNKDFTFWKNVDETITATMQRQTGQKGALTKVASIIAGAGGLAGGGVKSGATAYFFTKVLSNFVDSGLWKTLSGQAKKQIAEALIEGKVGDIYKILARIGTISKEVMTPEE